MHLISQAELNFWTPVEIAVRKRPNPHAGAYPLALALCGRFWGNFVLSSPIYCQEPQRGRADLFKWVQMVRVAGLKLVRNERRTVNYLRDELKISKSVIWPDLATIHTTFTRVHGQARHG